MLFLSSAEMKLGCDVMIFPGLVFALIMQFTDARGNDQPIQRLTPGIPRI